jgi:hypothetical protein
MSRRILLALAVWALGADVGTAAAAAAEPVPDAEQPPRLILDVEDVAGPVRALNGVQGGPLPPNSVDPILTEAYRAAGVRLVRLPQDLGFVDGDGEDCALTLGDIFPDAAADPEDPASYRFRHLDQFLDAARAAGAEVLWQAQYDLGADANAWAADGRQAGRAPRDPERWARVVVHVLRHLNDGWAGGHRWNVRAIEFPNDPCGLGGYDCRSLEGADGRPGRGRLAEDLIRLVRAVEAYNAEFGHDVRVAGPSMSAAEAVRWLPELAKALARAKLVLPILSYHDEAWPPELARTAQRLRQAADRAGLRETPVWNTGWSPPPAPADLRGLLDSQQRSAYAAAHAVQAKTLVQELWDAAILARAVRPAANPHRPDPTEGDYFVLDRLPPGAAPQPGDPEPGTPKPAYHAWRLFDEIAREYPWRLRVREAPTTPTLLASRSEDGRRISLLLAHFCPSHVARCAERQPYQVLLRGVDEGAYRLTLRQIDGSQPMPSQQQSTLLAGEPGLPVAGEIPLWSVQHLLIEPVSEAQ